MGKVRVIFSAGTGNDLKNAVRRVRYAVGILRSEPLIVVSMAVDNQSRSCTVQVFPEWPYSRIIANFARTEEWLMKICERAFRRMHKKIPSQPYLLGRTGDAPSRHV